MRDFRAYRRSTIRYWERRRIIYNAALLPPALLGFALADTINWVGDMHRTNYAHILPLFIYAAMGANVCYSFSYALEFVFGSDSPTSHWLRFGRSAVFGCGVLVAVLLALLGGKGIAAMEWNSGFSHVGPPGR